MADKYPDAALGEVVSKDENTETEAVEYTATIAAGDPLKLTGVNLEGQKKVAIAVAGDKAHLIAMFAGANGDIREALRKGIIKVTFSGAVAVGAAVKAAAASKFAAAVRTVTIPAGATAVTSTSANPSMTVEAGLACGYAISAPGADGDTGLIEFTGGVTP